MAGFAFRNSVIDRGDDARTGFAFRNSDALRLLSAGWFVSNRFRSAAWSLRVEGTPEKPPTHLRMHLRTTTFQYNRLASNDAKYHPHSVFRGNRYRRSACSVLSPVQFFVAIAIVAEHVLSFHLEFRTRLAEVTSHACVCVLRPIYYFKHNRILIPQQFSEPD